MTGTRAGALDIDFSGETKLEIWDLDLGRKRQDDELRPIASLNTDSRYANIGQPRLFGHREGIWSILTLTGFTT